MARPKTIIDAQLAQQARDALTGIRDRRLVIKLQAIISSEDHPIQTVARILGVGRQSVRNWTLAFRERGLDGLIAKPRGHRRSKLSAAQWGEVSHWLEHARTPEGKPCHWTLEKLRQTIKKHFGVQLGLTPVWRQVHKLGFRLKTPRPAHAQADPQQQAAFKKNR